MKTRERRTREATRAQYWSRLSHPVPVGDVTEFGESDDDDDLRDALGEY